MKPLFLGQQPAQFGADQVTGQPVLLDGQPFYVITNSDRLRPFFLTLVSAGDHWMFLSSNGALTAGRRQPDLALFPYYTDDKIHDTAETTGPKTILLVTRRQKKYLWEPFSERCRGVYRTRRNLYKSFGGNQIVLEEINDDLGLTLRSGWVASEQFGWVRKVSLASSGAVTVRLLDGLQNLLPCGVSSQFQLEKSTLIDAYKKSELLSECDLGLFLLSSIPVDRPEPAESLRATTVWSAGISRKNILLSAVQLENFRRDLPLRTETDVRAERGAYFVESEFSMRPGQTRRWLFAADVDQGPVAVARLRHELHAPAMLQKKVAADIRRGAEELWRMVASADGVQQSARALGDARHFNNVLCNVMRGGIFPDGYQLESADLFSFVRAANKSVAGRHPKFFRQLGKTAPRTRVLARARATGNWNLERLCHEYLPLTFSRRHGDPSRPWNRFLIPPRAESGTRVLNYEGNWRDIFQNWEALAVSFPGFVSGMICKFVNATTADGYNPYRVTRDGFDWEVHDPHDPWSHIGYWGDHQIIYLLKLLEILEQREPIVLRDFLTRNIFAFANVPYKIKSYADLLADPRATVDFDSALDALTRQRSDQIGGDGKLIWDRTNGVYHVNLTEKLLIPLLAKLANFISGAGIWLNTQRPEWNDANNALVGNGVSMVTLYQLRRHLAFCQALFASLAADQISLSREVVEWFNATAKILTQQGTVVSNDSSRKRILDALGRAAEKYRRQIYRVGFSGRKSVVTRAALGEFFQTALTVADQAISANRRADGLYHSYNLAEFCARGKVKLRRLHEMLEGQAAILSANVLSAKESVALLTVLKNGPMYRADQNSYLLYPDRRLPCLVEKNNLPTKAVASLPLLQKLLTDGNRLLIERDIGGIYHFNSRLTNAADVQAVLKTLAAAGYQREVKANGEAVLALFEQLFNHRSFTGRSGTFFGYEGLGCIYWHMVSKLLLATQETFLRFVATSYAGQLAEMYHEIRAGIGDFKSPENYGAFPMDPYSHTPGHTGARQPGLTGQVKEDILCRFGELGVSVRAGKIHFSPQLLKLEEFLRSPGSFLFLDVGGRTRKIPLPGKSLAFTYCQVPVIYRLATNASLTVSLAQGKQWRQQSPVLEEQISRAIFQRTGEITAITVEVPREKLFKLRRGSRTADASKKS